MKKIINISDKLSSDKPTLAVGDKEYPVEDGMDTVLKFEELVMTSTKDSMYEAVELALGKDAVEELEIKKMSMTNFKVIVIAVLAAMQGQDYDESFARFQEREKARG